MAEADFIWSMFPSARQHSRDNVFTVSTHLTWKMIASFGSVRKHKGGLREIPFYCFFFLLGGGGRERIVANRIDGGKQVFTDTTSPKEGKTCPDMMVTRAPVELGGFRISL